MNLIDVNIQDLKKWNRSDEIIYAQMQRQKYKYEFFQKAFDLIYDNTIQGDYFEFGGGPELSGSHCHKKKKYEKIKF